MAARENEEKVFVQSILDEETWLFLLIIFMEYCFKFWYIEIIEINVLLFVLQW